MYNLSVPEGSTVECTQDLFCGGGKFFAFKKGDICTVVKEHDSDQLYVDSQNGPRFYIHNDKLNFREFFKVR